MKVISLINMKGGVAKTTMAVNIADSFFTRKNKKVLLIDVDPQFNATQCVMSTNEYISYIENEGVTILDLFDSSSRPLVSTLSGKNEKQPYELEDIKPLKTNRGFDLIPGALELFKLEMASGQGKEMRLKLFLETVRNKYDYVIIDSPPTPSVWMSSALIASDFYLIPVKPDPISITGIDLLQGIINEKKSNYGFNCKCCGIVLTMVDKNSNDYKIADKYFKSTDKWKSYIYSAYLLKRVAVSRGQLSGNFIYDIADSDLNSQFSLIMNELERRI